MDKLPKLSDILAPISGLKDSQVGDAARASGVPKGTLIKILRGQTPNPRYESVRRISAYVVRMFG